MNARTALSRDDEARIMRAIGEAEKKTSAEVVCALATESGRYDRAASVVGLLAALLALVVAHAMPTTLQCVAVAAGFIAGSVLASCCRPLRASFVSPRERDAEVARAASHAFMRRHADSASRGAVLVYASLFERRVVVLAGKDAAEALGEPGLHEIRDAALAAIRAGKPAEAFLDAVARAAALLAYAFPPGDSNPDELSNRVMIFHPRP